MKVTLAYAYQGHGPDETVDLPDVEARRLLDDGRARRLYAAGVQAGSALAAGLTETTTRKATRKRAAAKPTPTTRPRHDSGTGRTKEK